LVFSAAGSDEEARKCFDEALAISEEIGSLRGKALALDGAGVARYEVGRIKESLYFHEQAFLIWEELGDRQGKAQTLLNTASCQVVLGQKMAALATSESALRLWNAVEGKRGEALTLRVMGFLFYQLGENQRALESLHEASELLLPMGDPKTKAVLFNTVGSIYFSMGENETARSYWEKALPLFREADYAVGEAASLMALGMTEHTLRNDKEALRYYRQALSVIRAVGDAHTEALAMREIGVAYSSSGHIQQAIEYLNRALVASKTLGDPRTEADTLNDLGTVHQTGGESQKALDFYRRALSLFQLHHYLDGETQVRVNIARLERDRGNLSEARLQFEEALSVAESIRSKVDSRRLRTSYMASIQDYYEFYVDLLVRLHQKEPSQGFDALAFQASERARARSLLESLSEATVDIRQGVDPIMLAEERRLQKQLNVKALEQARFSGDSVDSEEFRTIVREISDLTVAYDQLQARIRSASPRYAALTQPEPLSLEEIQQEVLDEETLLVEFALGRERSFLWAVSRTSSSAHELPPREEIETLARNLSMLLHEYYPKPGESTALHYERTEKALSRFWEESSTLSEMLLGPISDELQGKRLLIVSDGALHYVPFAALTLPGHRKDDLGPIPLISEHEIVRLPSASTLAILRREIDERAPAEKAVAVLADPIFETDDPRVRRSIAKAVPQDSSAWESSSSEPLSKELGGSAQDFNLSQDGFPMVRLIGTRQESAAIMALVEPEQGLLAVDFEASKTLAASSKLSEYRIVHFATHGVLNDRHPELSGVVLSLVNERGEFQDGFLRLHEIYNLNLPVELVVLSACDTGLGRQVRGEGLIGMVRGFMYAGSARVIASLWKVQDVATELLVKRFYQQLLEEKKPPTAALRAAQISMWKSRRWSSPFYWAAFEVHGEWEEMSRRN
jgi:CHAT domain-containing protein/tetratricopeptide (TPR) repeat protein